MHHLFTGRQVADRLSAAASALIAAAVAAGVRAAADTLAAFASARQARRAG